MTLPGTGLVPISSAAAHASSTVAGPCFFASASTPRMAADAGLAVRGVDPPGPPCRCGGRAPGTGEQFDGRRTRARGRSWVGGSAPALEPSDVVAMSLDGVVLFAAPLTSFDARDRGLAYRSRRRTSGATACEATIEVYATSVNLAGHERGERWASPRSVAVEAGPKTP